MAAPTATDPTAYQDWIRGYYDENQVLYDVFWSDRQTLSMGYGFWAPGTRSLSEAMANQHREMAERLAVGPSDVVLEAGCGVGGATVHICSRHGARGTGITLSHRQARRGRLNAQDRQVAERASFVVADFTRTGFADASFTRVFACESVCHALDKRAFAAEAARVLKPGGRLLVCDGFLARSELSAAEELAYREWCEGWALPGLATVDAFRDALGAAGFTRVEFVDRTDAVLRSARRIWWLGVTIGSAIWCLHKVGLARRSQVRHALACVRQYQVLAAGLARYGIFTAEKGEAGAEGAGGRAAS
jgi:cyclopropane fatty-acyl-phospholipid synthase-like methyltransferase